MEALKPHPSSFNQALKAILGKFWMVSRATIALVAIVVVLSSIASVSAPYVFSRLIDRLSGDAWTTATYAFAIYALCWEHPSRFSTRRSTCRP